MRIRMSRIITLILAFVFVQSFSSSFLISDQGTDVKDVSTGNLTSLANITIFIYEESSGGSPIFEQDFTDGIANGSWNVMIDPDLQYGQSYWKDYEINGENLDFDGNDRLEFQSSVGKINSASFINLSLISSCPAGSSIRLIHEDGSVECETDDTGAGSYNDSWINSTVDSKILTNNNSVNNYISFNNNSIINWITATFASLATIVNAVGNWSADKSNYYNTTQIVSINNSMKNYVDYVNSTNSAGSGTYNDTWINQTIYNKTQVNNINTSMQNYVNAQNTSQTNYINSNNNSINNYILYVNSTNGVGSSGEPLWTGNVTALNASWLTTYNATVNDSINNYISANNNSVNSYISSNNASVANYITSVNTSMKNYVDWINSTIIIRNGTNGINGTNGTNGINGLNGTNGTNGISFSNFSLYLPIANWNSTNTSYALYTTLMNGSFFNTASPDTFIANYSAFLNKINWGDIGNGTLALMSVLNNGSYSNANWNANYSQFLANNQSLTNYINSNNISVNNRLNSLYLINGTNGINGLNGTNGTNGINGLNGTNGTNGLNGTNGTDSINNTNWNNNYSTFLTHIPYSGANQNINLGNNNLTLGQVVNTSGKELILEQTGDGFGTSRLHLQNRNGAAGALFENLGLDLVDFGFKGTIGPQANIRFEHRQTNVINGSGSDVNNNSRNGEFQFLLNSVGGANAVYTFRSGGNVTSFPMGNIGIGTVNPFQKLHVNGSILANGTINATVDLCIQGGVCLSSVGAGGETNWNNNYSDVTFKNKSNSFGAYNQSFDNDTLYIDSTNNRIGIGTSTPSRELEVNGTLRFTDNSQFFEWQSGTKVLYDKFYSALNNYSWTSWNGSAEITNMMIIASNGYVGIGTTTPSTALEINSSSSGDGSLEFSTNQYGGRIEAKAGADAGVLYLGSDDGDIRAYTSGKNSMISLWSGNTTQNVIINSVGDTYFNGGNVGIGMMTSSSAKLDVNGTFRVFDDSVVNGVPFEITTGNNYNYLSSPGNEMIFDAYHFTFQAGGITKMSLNNNGSVGIGTASPSAKLDVNGSAAINGTLNMNSNNITSVDCITFASGGKICSA